MSRRELELHFEQMQKRMDKQRERLTKMVEFLEERGLIQDFNTWEDAQRGSSGSRQPEEGQQL